jgi:hypothetical protein
MIAQPFRAAPAARSTPEGLRYKGPPNDFFTGPLVLPRRPRSTPKGLRYEAPPNDFFTACSSRIVFGPVYTGVWRSGIGRPRNNGRQRRPTQRASRADRATLALSVAIPVLAYICR